MADLSAPPPAAGFTVLGAAGFVGRHVVAVLRARGLPVAAVGRRDPLPDGPLGHVVYCAGVTSDFRSRQADTVAAHVGLLPALLAADLDSFLYLSSTRVYEDGGSGREDAALVVRPGRPDELFKASKLAGEALCLADPRPGVRVARLSHVAGPALGGPWFAGPTLLDALLRATVSGTPLVVDESPRSARDVVDVRDVADVLVRIAAGGPSRCYNVATGTTTTTAELVAALTPLGLRAEFARPDARPRAFPAIAADRVRAELGFAPRPVLAGLPALVSGAGGGRGTGAGGGRGTGARRARQEGGAPWSGS